MSNLKAKIFWIGFPLTVLAVSIFAVNRIDLHQHRAQITSSTQDPATIASSESTVPTPQPEIVTVPVNTAITVRLDQSIATNSVTSGDPFFATVARPIRVNGKAAIPEGARVKGRVVSVREAGRLKGVAHIALALNTVEVNGSVYDLHSNTFTKVGHNHNKRNLEFIGGGSVGGALIGGLVGGGKGALIGAPIGAATGTTGAVATANREIFLPAETAMTFRLLTPLAINL